MTSVESQAPTLARLSFWVPPERMAILKKHGLVDSAQRGPDTVTAVFSRLFGKKRQLRLPLRSMPSSKIRCGSRCCSVWRRASGRPTAAVISCATIIGSTPRRPDRARWPLPGRRWRPAPRKATGAHTTRRTAWQGRDSSRFSRIGRTICGSVPEAAGSAAPRSGRASGARASGRTRCCWSAPPLRSLGTSPNTADLRHLRLTTTSARSV